MSRFRFYRDDVSYCLQDRYSSQRPLRVSFSDPSYVQRLRKAGRKSELVARAVKPRPSLKVLDCTAGLAREGFLLAYLGCNVTLLERSLVIGEMVQSAIDHALRDDFLSAAAARLQLVLTDASDFLRHTHDQFDVIYIDPMFPEKKGSAAVSGDMQILQRYLGVDEDAGQLVSLALAHEKSRIVLKRPADGDWQPPVEPAHVFKGKSSRYELFGV